jgi:hypothetical protein
MKQQRIYLIAYSLMNIVKCAGVGWLRLHLTNYAMKRAGLEALHNQNIINVIKSKNDY